MSYEIRRYTPLGELVEIITAFQDLDYVRAENRVGGMTLTVPMSRYAYSDFSVNQVLEIWRDGQLQNETAYLLKDWLFYSHDRDGDLIKLYAPDANQILTTRIVAYDAGSSYADKSDYADDMMKEVVYENFGGGAATLRQIDQLTIAGDDSASETISKAFSRRNVMRVLEEIAQSATEAGTYTVFDVIRTGQAQFEFRTYTGQRGNDHGSGSGDLRLVGEQYGSLTKPEFGTYYSDEITYVFCGGQGQEDEREVVTADAPTRRITGSPFNRREVFRDARHCETTTCLDSEAEARLREGEPKQILSGQIVDTPGLRYNVHYGFGDIVSVEAFGFTVDCHVTTVRGRYSRDKGEDIMVRVRGEV